MSADVAGALVDDPELPAAAVLLGPRASDALTAAVAPDGGVVRSATLRSADYSPGRSVRASYHAVVEWPHGDAEEMLGAAAYSDGSVRGERVADIDGLGADVWLYPDDPYLPALADATDPAFVGWLLDQLGLDTDGFELEVRGYSPRSRAVVEVAAAPAGGTVVFRPGQGFAEPRRRPVVFLKVLRPERAQGLLDAHAALEECLPVAACLYDDAETGLLALAPLSGVPLWDCVVSGPYDPLDAEELLEVLEAIEDVDLGRPGRISPTRAARLNMDALAALLPDRRDDLERFRERLGEDAPQPAVTIHGDFHEVQLLVGREGLAGVLDLDDAGRGERVDDLAMMLGRVWCYAQTEAAARPRAMAYFEELLAEWSDHVEPRELRRRTAAVAMNDALQPFRAQEPGWRARCAERIARAHELLAQLVPQ